MQFARGNLATSKCSYVISWGRRRTDNERDPCECHDRANRKSDSSARPCNRAFLPRKIRYLAISSEWNFCVPFPHRFAKRVPWDTYLSGKRNESNAMWVKVQEAEKKESFCFWFTLHTRKAPRWDLRVSACELLLPSLGRRPMSFRIKPYFPRYNIFTWTYLMF